MKMAQLATANFDVFLKPTKGEEVKENKFKWLFTWPTFPNWSLLLFKLLVNAKANKCDFGASKMLFNSMLKQIFEIKWILASFKTRKNCQIFAHFEPFELKWTHHNWGMTINLGWKTLIWKHKQKVEKRNINSDCKYVFVVCLSFQTFLHVAHFRIRISQLKFIPTPLVYQIVFLITKWKGKCVVAVSSMKCAYQHVYVLFIGLLVLFSSFGFRPLVVSLDKSYVWVGQSKPCLSRSLRSNGS